MKDYKGIRSPDELPRNNPPLRISGYDAFRVRRGGMAVVYLCEYSDTDGIVNRAVKVMQPELAVSAEVVGMFVREAYLWLLVGSHANITKAISVHLAEPEPPILVLEYVPTSLRDVLDERVLTPIEACCVGPDIVAALRHASDALGSFVHGDIKPENVLFDGLLFKLTDLGLAKASITAERVFDHGRASIRMNTNSLQLGGTPLYMAPEQGLGLGASEASDVYSLGCVLYEAGAGDPPIGRPQSVDDCVARHLHTMAPDLRIARPEISVEFAAIVAACLEKDPSRRPTLSEVDRRLRRVALTYRLAERPTNKSAPTVDERFRVALGLLNLGFGEDAFQVCQGILREAPGALAESQANVLLARSCTSRGLLDDADGFLNAASAAWAAAGQTTPDPGYLTERGRLALELGDETTSMRFAEEAAVAAPTSSVMWANLANRLYAAGDRMKAIECLQRAVTVSADVRYFVNLISWLVEGGSFESAIRWASDGIEFHPTSGLMYCLRCYAIVAAVGNGNAIHRSFATIAHSDLELAVKYAGPENEIRELTEALRVFPRDPPS